MKNPTKNNRMKLTKLFTVLALMVVIFGSAYAQKPRIENAELYFVNGSALIDNTNFTNEGKGQIWCSGHERREIGGVVYYNMTIYCGIANSGAAAGEFRVTLTSDDPNANITYPITSMGMEVRNLALQVWLPVGSHNLLMKIDDLAQVPETNETNNELRFTYLMNDDCSKTATPNNVANEGSNQNPPTQDYYISKNPKKPNLPKGKIDISQDGGGVMIGGKFVPWGGSVKLSCKDALPGGGANNQYGFNVTYKVKNHGSSATGTFLNKLYSGAGGATVRAINSGLQLNAGEVKEITTQPYLDCGATYILTFKFDNDNSVIETNEENNKFYIMYYLDCTPCRQ